MPLDPDSDSYVTSRLRALATQPIHDSDKLVPRHGGTESAVTEELVGVDFGGAAASLAWGIPRPPIADDFHKRRPLLIRIVGLYTRKVAGGWGYGHETFPMFVWVM